MNEIKNNPKVALIGGGYTLQRVAALLPEKSFVITSRDQARCLEWRKLGWLSARVSLDQGDTIRDLFRDFPSLKVIVDSVPPLREGNPAYGVLQTIDALKVTGVKRVIYLSTTGVFGVRDGSFVDESTPLAKHDPLWNLQGQARLASEDAYRTLIDLGLGIEFTALRLPAIYGPDRGVAVALRNHTYTLIDDGARWTNRIHVDDLARIITRSIEYDGVLPGVLCVSDDSPTQARDVVSYLCEREGLSYPPSITADEALRRGAYTMLSNQRIKNTTMKRVLEIELQYPSFREGTALS